MISVDITGPHPKSARGNEYMVTVIDDFSKWVEAFAVRNHTAPTVAKVLVDQVFSRWDTPCRLLVDNGPEFRSELFSEVGLQASGGRQVAYDSISPADQWLHRALSSHAEQPVTPFCVDLRTE